MTPGTRTTLTSLATAVVLGAGATTALVAPAQAGDADSAAPVTLSANLTASGDSNGSGHATFTITKAKKKVCATVSWTDIAKPTAAHIHRKSDGEIVVDLVGSVTGGAKCAKGVSKQLIQKILDKPGKYYFNVHNTPYPAGAIQGALRR
jgi:hypothetical protein